MSIRKIISIILVLFIFIQVIFYNYSIAKEKKEYVIVLNGSDENKVEIPEDESKKIYSESAILIESTTGKVLYDKNMYERKYPASTTKILTAIIAIEKCNLNEKATASEVAVNSVKSGYTTAGILPGETFTIGELLDVLMIVSANEAANIIAEHVSGNINEFTKLMNEKAKEIGCLDSNFVNANGAHEDNHYSTAYDLALIARYCMRNETFRNICVKMNCRLPATDLSEERIFRNTNNLFNKDSIYYYPYCTGIKSGFTTPAKNCLISSSNKDGFELISVILHAESTVDGLSARYTDTIKLFEYGYNNYTLDEILEEYNLDGISQKNNNRFMVLTNFFNNKNQNERDYTIDNKAVVEIVIGIAMLLILGFWFIYRKITKFSNKKIYGFKLK